MKTSTLLILGAAGAAGVYFVTRPKASIPGPTSKQIDIRTKARLAGASIGKLFAGKAPAKSAASQQNYAAPAAGSPGVGAKDIVTAGAAVAAGAGCNLVPGVGTALSPLCGTVGGYLGAKAYDYADSAIDEISSWF